jgi:NAD+ synthase (glutamine-hydrolysing)
MDAPRDPRPSSASRTLGLRLQQTNPSLGDFRANLERQLAHAEAAAAAGRQVVLFPELSLTGYFLKDQVAELAIDLNDPRLAPLREVSRSITVAIGLVERGRGDRLYNTLAVFEDGELIHRHRKVHLVTYGMFEEGRDFAEGDRYRAFECKHGRFGVLICEDAWHAVGGYLYGLADVDAILVASASPLRGLEAARVAESAGAASGGHPSSSQSVETLLAAQALMFQTYVAYANRVGWEDGIGFGGGSALFGPDGRRLSRLEGFEPGHLDVDLSASTLRRARQSTPLRRDERPSLLLDGLVQHLEAAEANLD